MRISHFLLCIVLTISFNIDSISQNKMKTVPASPYPLEIIQDDGSRIQVLGNGDERFSYATTLDGYCIVKNNLGIYEYAVTNEENRLSPSGRKATDPTDRLNDDSAFLENLNTEVILNSIMEEQMQTEVLKSAGINSDTGIYKAFPPTGNRSVLTILIEYPDLNNTHSNSDFNNLLNQPNYNGTGSFRDYFNDASRGQLMLTTDVFGWYVAANNYAYYGNDNGFDVSRELVAEAIDAAEAAGVDFSQYDNDGDGYVDGITIVHSGPGAEEGSQTEYIWSHRWVLGSTYQRTYDGVTIYDYNICPETRSWGITGIGVFCHEFGHVLGLPDLYDTNSSNGTSAGIGRWGLMGSGSWLNNENSPANMTAWSRIELGWISTIPISDGSFTVQPSANVSSVYKILTGEENEYFLLENRQNTGLDEYLPGEGLAIWHIDDDQYTNADETHKMVDLEEADGQDNLDLNENRGDSGDLYPGSTNATAFNGSSYPNSDLYSSQESGVNIHSISENGLEITFTLEEENVTDPCENIISIDACNEVQTFVGGGEGVWSLHTCELNPPGVEQVYSFIAPVTGIYSIEVITAEGTVDYGYRSSPCAEDGWSCINQINTTGTHGWLSWTAGTTYYILLDDANTLEGIHEFYITCPDTQGCEDEYESNGTRATANTTAFNTLSTNIYNRSISGTIHDGSDVDFYRLNVTVAGTLNLDLPNPPADFDLALINASGETIAYSGTSGSESLSYEFMGNEAGYYYIQVYGYQGANSCSDYDLVLEWIPYYLDVSPDSRTVDYTAGSTSFSVSRNVAWDVSDDASWLTTTEASTTTIGVTYSANTSGSTRTAYITVTAYGGLTETVTVVQNPDNPQSCEDAYESNNTRATANTSAFSSLSTSIYNRSIDGSIHDAADEDYYRINVTVAGTLNLELPDPPDDYDLALISASGETIAYSGTYGSESLSYEFMGYEAGYYYIHVYGYQGANSCSEYELDLEWIPYYLDVTPDSRTVDQSAGSTTFNVSRNVAWDVSDDASWLTTTEASTTTIGVTYSENTSTSSRTANITVTAYGGLSEIVTVVQNPANPQSCEDAYESNNTRATANTSAFSSLSTSIYNRSINGTIHDASDEDYYRLTVSVAGTLHLDLPGPPANFELALVNASGQILEFSGTSGSESLTYEFMGNEAGYYFIYIFGDNGASSCTEYDLDLEWIPYYLDVTPDSRRVEHTAGSTTFNVSTNVAWDVSDDAPWLTTTESNTTTIGVSYSANTTTSARTANITVTAYGGQTETVTVVQDPDNPPCEDNFESNNTLPTANTSAFSNLGTTSYSGSLSATIHDDTDEDYYRINITSAGTVNLNLPTPPADFDLELKNESGDRIAYSGTSGSEFISYEVNSPGYYYIYVYGYYGANSCTEYDLYLEWNPHYLDVTPDSRSVDHASGSTSFTVSTNTGWDVSDDASWLTAVETNVTTVSVYYDANNTSIQRTANITVSATGGLTETVIVVQDAESIQDPNLTTHKPSGWDDRVIVSAEVGTHQNDSVVDGMPSFVDLAWTNNGLGAAGAYTSCLILDSDTISYFDSPGLPAGSIDDIIDRGFTFTGVGWHVLKVVLDVYNDVDESNEDDNDYQKSFYVKSTVSVESLNLSDNILLYPNPSDGKFTLELQNSSGERYSIEIIDPTGKVVWDNQIENQGLQVKESIDLSFSPAGLYFVKVFNNNTHSVKKLILVK